MKRAVLEAVGVVLLAALLGGVTLAVHPKFPGFAEGSLEEGEISVEQALGLDSPVIWIDARSRDSFMQETIPGAILLNETEYNSLFAEFIPLYDPAATLVVFCDSQACHASKNVALRLGEDLGHETVFTLRGGWDAWTMQDQTQPK